MNIDREKKNLLIPIILLKIVFSVMLSADFALAAEKQIEMSSNIFIVGTELDYPPYSFLDEEGKPTGFNVDLTRAIAKAMGLRVDIQVRPWGNIRDNLSSDKIDVIAGMYYSKERAKRVDFSPPYTIVHHAIFARRDSPRIKSEKELRGKKIVVMRGDIMHDYVLKEGFTKNPGLATTQAEALRLLASGKYDFALTAKLPGLYWVNKLSLSDIEIVGPLLRPSEYCYAVKAGNFELLSDFCEGLAIIKKTGEMKAIYDNWLGVLEPRGVPKSVILKYVGLSLLVSLLIFLVVVFWFKSLKRQVARKTEELEEEITERNHTEKALRENEALQRILLENMPAGVVIVNPETRIIERVNNYVGALFGAPANHLVGQRCHSLLCPADEGACPVCDLGQVVDNSEREMLRKDGSRLTILKTVTRFEFDGKEKLLECFVDLSARKLAEEALRESEKKFSTLFHASPVYIALTSLDNGSFLEVNESFTKITGFEPKEVLGRTPVEIGLWADPEKRKQFINLVEQQGRFHEVEVTFRRKNGEPLFGLWSAEKIESGDEPCLISVLVDITERKENEEALKNVNEQLEQAIEKAHAMAVEAEVANMAKSEFLANMSHEIRTPMNAVIGFTDMLLDTGLDQDQVEFAETVKRSGENLLTLINDILDFSKIEAGNLDFDEIDFDPELLAYDVCDVIRPRIGTKPIELLCHVGDNVPSFVKGDPTRFRQVLTNLMGNAPKFTESGEIELYLDVDEEEDNRVKLHTKIRDTGIGLQKDKLSIIFEPFKQADCSTTRKYGGTGLGLSISKKISRLMDGNVWVESEESKGATFHFTAWFEKAEDKVTDRYVPAALTKKRALIVDDNQTNLEILAHHLELVGMYVVALGRPEDVLPTLKESLHMPFDVCIADIQMPGMSGYEIAKEIRDAHTQFSNIRLIALSSLMKRDAKKCREAGFDGFLSKPIRRKRLYQMLEKVLGEKKDEPQEIKPSEIITQYSLREEMKHAVRILLVEDNPVNQKLGKLMLTKGGYQVEVANNGKEAVEKYTTSPDNFDLIFMDIQMPEMDGVEATQKIRERGFNAVPIVAMTAHAMKGDREVYLEAGMNDYISKPVRREIVFDILEKWVFEREKHEAKSVEKSWMTTSKDEF